MELDWSRWRRKVTGCWAKCLTHYSSFHAFQASRRVARKCRGKLTHTHFIQPLFPLYTHLKSVICPSCLSKVHAKSLCFTSAYLTVGLYMYDIWESGNKNYFFLSSSSCNSAVVQGCAVSFLHLLIDSWCIMSSLLCIQPWSKWREIDLEYLKGEGGEIHRDKVNIFSLLEKDKRRICMAVLTPEICFSTL